MFQQDILDLGGKQIFAAADDHFLHPAGDLQEAAPVDGAKVAGVEPAIGINGLGGGIGVIIIA